MAAVSRQGGIEPFDVPDSSFGRSSGTDDDFSWDESDRVPAPAEPAAARPHPRATAGEPYPSDEDDWLKDHDYTESRRAATPPGKPPFPWLAASVGLSLLGLVLALILRQTWPGLVLAWLLAGPLAILALAQYVVKDGLQRARPMYTGADWTRHLPTIMGVLALACVVVVAVVAAGKVARAW